MADPGTAQEEAREPHVVAIAAALLAFYELLEPEVLGRLADGLKNLIPSLWSARLTEAVVEPLLDAGHDLGERIAAEISDEPVFDPSTLDAYLEQMAENYGVQHVANLREMVNEAAREVEAEAEAEVARLLQAEKDRAEQVATEQVNKVANFAGLDAAKAEGMTTKTWHTGPNSRATHAAQDGLTIGIDERFPNGQRFPGSPAPPEETANCNCDLTFGTEDS
ncbi:phage minor head protein [Nocardioides sp. NPDC101246]|uniref:phage minor head protein n=1 Tax=Nocardioides sp. NPDC101246 TaxID=3364336 RepID=UPI0038289B5D